MTASQCHTDTWLPSSLWNTTLPQPTSLLLYFSTTEKPQSPLLELFLLSAVSMPHSLMMDQENLVQMSLVSYMQHKRIQKQLFSVSGSLLTPFFRPLLKGLFWASPGSSHLALCTLTYDPASCSDVKTKPVFMRPLVIWQVTALLSPPSSQTTHPLNRHLSASWCVPYAMLSGISMSTSPTLLALMFMYLWTFHFSSLKSKVLQPFHL